MSEMRTCGGRGSVAGCCARPASSCAVTPCTACLPAPHHCAQVAAVFTVPLRRFLEAGPGYSFRDVEWQRGLPYR